MTTLFLIILTLAMFPYKKENFVIIQKDENNQIKRVVPNLSVIIIPAIFWICIYDLKIIAKSENVSNYLIIMYAIAGLFCILMSLTFQKSPLKKEIFFKLVGTMTFCSFIIFSIF